MATYLIGQSVVQFSFAMGWFLASMGLGSYLSRFARKELLRKILYIQIVVAISGGYSAAFLFFAFAYTDVLYPHFMLIALLVGTGVGFEIPIMLRLMGEVRILSLAVSDVFTFDYIGALLASILFPLLLLPHFGLIRSSLFFGLLNLLSGFFILQISGYKNYKKEIFFLTLSLIFLVSGFFYSEKLTRFIEDRLYQDPIVLTRDTRYQRIVVTKWRGDLRLFLDGNLQFSTQDEKRYHESLVHVPIFFLGRSPKSVLVIGGGDGLAVRELLKYSSIESITVLELDPEMIRLFSTNLNLTKINENSLKNEKVHIINEDAFTFLKQNREETYYDLIITDLPDPNNHSIGKLYTVTFYSNLLKKLEKNGIFVTQSTSPLFAKEAFWCIKETIDYTGKKIFPSWKTSAYHTYIPSFGEWGFILGKVNLDIGGGIFPEVKTGYLNPEIIPGMFSFPKDMLPTEPPPINHLDSQVLITLYSRAYHRLYE